MVQARQSVCQSLAGQYQVNTQAAVSAKTGGAVVPPAVTFLFLLKQAEGVGQSQVQYFLQGLAFRGAAEDAFVPGFRVIYITVIRCDVEITDHHKACMLL